MYKEEMDRLGFSVGGFFKGLAALSEIKDVFEAPPKTAYEELQDKANEKYRDKPADKEMFDVTTNYLMEEEDRNIQDAELMEELNTTAESWTNAEPEKFVKHYPIEEIELNWDEIKSEYQRDMEFFGRFADYYDVEQKRLRQEVLGLEEKKRVVEERVGIGWSSDPEWKELNKQWRGKSDEQHEMWSKYSDYKYDRPRERRKVPFTDRDLNIYIQRIKNPEEKKFALALMEWNKEQVEARNIKREKDSIYGINIYADPRLNIFSGLSGKQLTDKSYDEMRVLSRINKVNQSKGMPDEPTRIRGFKPGWHVGAQELSTIEAHTSAIMEAFDDRSWAKKRMERWKDEPLMQDAYLRAKEDFEGFGDPPLLYQSFAPDKMVSLLDQPGLYGQYKRGSDRINWDDEQTKTHELLHRYMDLSGVVDKLFKEKRADEEMFVRAYTAKILGEPLDDDFWKDLKRVADVENYHNITEEYDEEGHWKTTIKSRSDIDKLRKDFPTLSKNFEELVLGRKHIELVSDKQKGKDVLSYDKSKPTILSEQILSTIQKNRGWSSEELNALKEFSNSVSKAESDNKIDVHQYGGGPGRGKYQYEIGDEQGASTARNRLLNFAKDNNITIPQKYLDLLGKQGTQSIDFSALPEDLQTALFFADKAKHPEFKLDDLVSGRLSPVDAWLAYHWAGEQVLKEEKRKYFLDKNKLEKRSKLIRYPIGVDTPIFTTQEEADAYIGGVAKGIRSAIRGVIQGVARYTGPADIATYGKIMAPPRLGGIGTGPKFYQQEEITWLEEAQKFASGVGKTVVPGDVQEEGVMVSQEATGLVILGVGIKDAVRLIRHYGPQAVAKIKNYFVKNPESTVDEAVKGVLGKAATRRDVIKGMGTGAAVAGTASILGKAGMVLKGAAGAKVIAGVATAKFANQIPINILKGSTVFKRHWSGSKEQIVGNKMFNADWTINEKVFPTQGLSTKYPKDPRTEYGTWGEIDHIAIRDMPKLKPHFEKYGLKPNEITKLDRHVQDEYQMLPENFVRGKAASQYNVTKFYPRGFDIKGKLLDIDKAFYPKSTGNPVIDRAVEIADILKPRKTRLTRKTPDDKRLRELGYSWHDRLDAIKYMHKNPKDFNKQLNQVAEDLAEEALRFGRTTDEYLNPSILNKKNLITEKEALKFFEDSKYMGTKDGMEFFEIDGIPVIRKVQEQRGDFAPWDYDDAIRMAEEPQAPGYWNYEGEAVSTSDIYMPNIRGLERLRGKKFTDKELQELDDLTLFRYTSKFLPE